MKIARFLVVILLPILQAQAVEWNVDTQAKNLVKFISRAPLEEFEGITNHIDGYIYWEGDSVFSRSNEMYFEVDLRTIDTGIGLRNRHMRENYLETDRWPYAVFQGKVTEVSRLDTSVVAYRAVATGTLSIHGVDRTVRVEGRVLFPETDRMRIQVRFQVKLTDYRIKIPRIMFFKLNEIIQLELDFFLVKVAD
ncbi:MAG: YceI family protein [Calditrichaeota bacterium]|nr:YceI family protein [Calditrichota bacterium]